MKDKILTGLIPMIIFLAIGCVSVYFLIARPVDVVEIAGAEIRVSPAATSLEGLAGIGEVWKEYPDYMTGLSVLAGLGFSGAVYCSYLMSRENLT